MEIEDLKPNSHAYREMQKKEKEKNERKPVRKVVNGNVKRKKKSGAQKLAERFFHEDASNIKSYLVDDVAIPHIKKLISDLLVDTIDIAFNGSAKRRDSGDRFASSFISYSSYAKKKDKYIVDSSKSKIRFDYDDLIFPSRGAADAVLEEMGNMIEAYNQVSVADMYDMANVDDVPFTANKYGWTSIRNARVERLRDGGYIINLPKAKPLD